MSGLMPAYILREWTNDGKLLRGGRIYFYESGTTTPKSIYADTELTIELTNPVVLDASGAADIFLGDGAYRVLIQDSNGVQVRPPLDGIVGTGGSGGLGGDVKTKSFLTYDGLRTLTTVPDLVYVAGRTSEGDGGQGWFQLVPASTLIDDDGVVLTSGAGAHVYQRIYSGDIDPRWFGVRYNVTVDNFLSMYHALAASVVHNRTVKIAGPTYIAQDLPVVSGSSLFCDIDGFFHTGTTVVTMTFASLSRFSADGIAFGNNVHAGFCAEVVPEVRLSWFGGVGPDESFGKFASSLDASNRSHPQYFLVDRTYGLTLDVAFPANAVLRWSAGCEIQLSQGINFSAPAIEYDGLSPIVTPLSIGVPASLVLGNGYVRPEWFGATGSGDSTTPLQMAFLTGRVRLLPGRSYIVGSLTLSMDSDVRCFESTASLPVLLMTGVISGTAHKLNLVNVAFTGSGTVYGISADSSEINLSALLINGQLFDFVDCLVSLTGSVNGTRSAPLIVSFVKSTLNNSQNLSGYILSAGYESCAVNGSKAPVSSAVNSTFSCPLNLVANASLKNVDVSNSGFSPTLDAQSAVTVNAVGCTFINTAMPPTALASKWVWPLSGSNVTATYNSCLMNGKQVNDPKALSIDGVPVKFVGTNHVPVIVPFSSWAGLPAGLSSSGDAIFAGSDVSVENAINDGTGFTAPSSSWGVYPSQLSSASLPLGFAVITASLSSSHPEDYVDISLGMPALFTNSPVSNVFPGSYGVSMKVRNFDMKCASRVYAGMTIQIPVWVGACDPVVTAYADGINPVRRNTTDRLQIQLVGIHMHQSATLQVLSVERVVDDKRIFDALYNAPNKSLASIGYPPYWVTGGVRTDGQMPVVETYSFLGIDYRDTGKMVMRVQHNDAVTPGVSGQNIGSTVDDSDFWMILGDCWAKYWDITAKCASPMWYYHTSAGNTSAVDSVYRAKTGSGTPGDGSSIALGMNLFG